MTTLLRWLTFGIGVAALALGWYVAQTWDRTWDAPLPAIQASTDPTIIRHGEYLVRGPAHCVDCHATSPAIVDDEETGEPDALAGGMTFALPPIGAIYARNLTPDRDTGLGRYSDAQIARVLRYSVLPDGQASVQPLMPYVGMSDEDLIAIVSYLRAQPPVRHQVPHDEWTMVG